MTLNVPLQRTRSQWVNPYMPTWKITSRYRIHIDCSWESIVRETSQLQSEYKNVTIWKDPFVILYYFCIIISLREKSYRSYSTILGQEFCMTKVGELGVHDLRVYWSRKTALTWFMHRNSWCTCQRPFFFFNQAVTKLHAIHSIRWCIYICRYTLWVIREKRVMQFTVRTNALSQGVNSSGI